MKLAKPFVYLNMAQSLDGKITTIERLKVRIGSSEDRDLMENLRSQADAVLIGKGTLIADDPLLIVRQSNYIKERETNKKNSQPINIVVSSKIDFLIENSVFFAYPHTEKIVITTQKADSSSILKLKKYADVYLVSNDENNRVHLKEALNLINNLGINHLLLEGGGSLNFSMLENDLIDEIYITLCPFIMGGPASTIFDGKGFTKEQIRKMKLVDVRKGKYDELFLKYKLLQQSPNVKKNSISHKGYEVS